MDKKDRECVCACVCTHVCSGLLLSCKKNTIMPPAAYGMDLDTTILNELSQTYIQYHSYVTSKKFKPVTITEKMH